MKNGVRLNGRILWFDGDSSFETEALYDYILSGKPLNDKCFVVDESEDIQKFNALQTELQVENENRTQGYSESMEYP